MSAWEGSVWQAGGSGGHPSAAVGCASTVLPGAVTFVNFNPSVPHVHSWKKAPNADAISCSACGFIVTGAEIGAMNMAINAVGK